MHRPHHRLPGPRDLEGAVRELLRQGPVARVARWTPCAATLSTGRTPARLIKTCPPTGRRRAEDVTATDLDRQPRIRSTAGLARRTGVRLDRSAGGAALSSVNNSLLLAARPGSWRSYQRSGSTDAGVRSGNHRELVPIRWPTAAAEDQNTSPELQGRTRSTQRLGRRFDSCA